MLIVLTASIVLIVSCRVLVFILLTLMCTMRALKAATVDSMYSFFGVQIDKASRLRIRIDIWILPSDINSTKISTNSEMAMLSRLDDYRGSWVNWAPLINLMPSPINWLFDGLCICKQTYLCIYIGGQIVFV